MPCLCLSLHVPPPQGHRGRILGRGLDMASFKTWGPLGSDSRTVFAVIYFAIRDPSNFERLAATKFEAFCKPIRNDAKWHDFHGATFLTKFNAIEVLSLLSIGMWDTAHAMPRQSLSSSHLH